MQPLIPFFMIVRQAVEVTYSPTDLILFAIVGWLVVQQLIIWKKLSYLEGWIKGECNGNKSLVPKRDPQES